MNDQQHWPERERRAEWEAFESFAWLVILLLGIPAAYFLDAILALVGLTLQSAVGWLIMLALWGTLGYCALGMAWNWIARVKPKINLHERRSENDTQNPK